ncbi:MAG: ATP-binding protein [Sphaerochaeta sp.]
MEYYRNDFTIFSQNRGISMLLEFRMKNYKSFKDECNFSMQVAPKQKGLDYSILSKRVGKKYHKALSTAVIYGPNASGKTNIIGAMDTFKQIILRGHIRNTEQTDSPNIAANVLELIPNNANQSPQPVTFSMTFIDQDHLFEYSIALDLGRFSQRNYKRRIIEETLNINSTNIFTRSETLEIGDLTAIDSYLLPAYKQNIRGAVALAQNSLHAEELFLCNGFKTMFSTSLISAIMGWVNNHFTVIYKSDTMQLTRIFSNQKKHSVFIEKTLNEAAALFGVNSNVLGYVLDGQNDEAQLCSMFRDGNKQIAIPVELFESHGTIRFINLFPLILRTLAQGGVLVVDELDAALHPSAVMNIITLFHNDELNVHRAQLIFNTHNPIFLNANLFRRDEIKFVERDDNTHTSNHYSLSDFGTSGTTGVRQTDDYLKNYFVERYGAIKDIDLTPIIKDFMARSHKRDEW